MWVACCGKVWRLSGTLNGKLETRNPKFETNSNPQISNDTNVLRDFLLLRRGVVHGHPVSHILVPSWRVCGVYLGNGNCSTGEQFTAELRAFCGIGICAPPPLQEPWGRLSSLPSKHFGTSGKREEQEGADRNVCPTCVAGLARAQPICMVRPRLL